MRRMPHVIWVFPLMIIGAAVLVYQIGASQLTRSFLKQKLAEQYGVSGATIEYYASIMPAVFPRDGRSATGSSSSRTPMNTTGVPALESSRTMIQG